MRILIYTDSFPPAVGGYEKFIYDFSLGLSKIADEIYVFTYSGEFRNEGIKNLHILNSNYHFSLQGYKIVSPGKIIRIIREKKIDTIVFNGPTVMENVLLIKRTVKKLKILIIFHSAYQSLLARLIFKLVARITYNSADLILVQNSSDQLLLEKIIRKKRKLVKIYFNGLLLSNMNKSVNLTKKIDSKILFVGRLDRAHNYKGLDQLLLFFESLKDKLPREISLTVVGDGDLRPFYEDMVKKKGIDRTVEFLGEVSDEKVKEEMRESAALILPSINEREGFGRVVLEALAQDTTVIVSNRAGISELIKKYECGFVYDPDSKEELLTILSKLNQNRPTIEQYRLNARIMIKNEEFDMDHLLSKIVNLLDKKSTKSFKGGAN